MKEKLAAPDSLSASIAASLRCLGLLQSAVEKIKDAAFAAASLNKKVADIIFNPALVGAENIRATIEAAGFKATQTISEN